MGRDPLWNVERSLWTDGAGAFDKVVAEDCLMAFPGIGLMDRAAAIAGLKAAPRWAEVEMSAEHLVQPRDSLAVLGYVAEARRAGGDPYRAICTSTYCATDDGWRLVQHQQTKAD